MQLINPAIIYGLGLAAVPVLLHMMLRARPKPHLFPALRLLEQRRRHNRRRLRLRHIWLLLLRVALIVLIVLAVARPTEPPVLLGRNTKVRLRADLFHASR